MLSVGTVAERIGLSPQTIRSWCREGLLPAVRPRGAPKWLIPEDSFDRWLERSGNELVEFASLRRSRATDAELLAEAANPEGSISPEGEGTQRREPARRRPHAT